MKTQTLVTFFLTLFTCSSLFGQEHSFDFSSGFKAYDLNKTGFIERVEFEDHIARYFDFLDKDHDGVLSKKEMEGIKGWHERFSKKHKRDTITIIEFVAYTDALFEANDKNKDRKLSEKEFAKLDPATFVLTQKSLPRLCVGDINDVALSWVLYEKNKKEKYVQRYATIVPEGLTWTCLPLHSEKAEYKIRVTNHKRQTCELEVKANQWVLVREQNGLNCSKN